MLGIDVYTCLEEVCDVVCGNIVFCKFLVFDFCYWGREQ